MKAKLKNDYTQDSVELKKGDIIESDRGIVRINKNDKLVKTKIAEKTIKDNPEIFQILT